MAAPSTSLDKRAFFLLQLSEIPIVRVHVAGLVDGLRIPDRLKVPSVAFEYGLNLMRPIPDLVADHVGIYATLSFGGELFRTFIPWAAVFAIVDSATGRGVVWQNDIPPEAFDKAPPAKRPSHLRLVQ